MTILIVVLSLAGRADALQLTSRVNALSTPKPPRVIEKVHAITSEHIYLGDSGVKMQRPDGLHLEPGLIENDGKVFWTVDSGATAICIPVEDEWMLDRITDARPNIGVEAADGIQLSVGLDPDLPWQLSVKSPARLTNLSVVTKGNYPMGPSDSGTLITTCPLLGQTSKVSRQNLSNTPPPVYRMTPPAQRVAQKFPHRKTGEQGRLAR